MAKKLVYLFALVLLFISFISSQQSSLGTFKQYENITLVQTCASCTYNNVTNVILPNSTIIIMNKAMTKTGSFYNYSFDKTDLLGDYIVNGIGNIDGNDTVWVYNFKITYNGKELSSSSSTFYIILFAIFVLLFFLTVYGINKLPGSNAKDEEGRIIQISYLKYLRSTLWFVCWMLIVAIFYISSNLSFAYLEDTLVANFFFTLFKISFGLSAPIVVVWFIWIFVRIFDDKKIKGLWERGMY